MKLDDLSYKNALEYEQQKDNVDVTSKLPQEAIKDLVQREFLFHAKATRRVGGYYPFNNLVSILEYEGYDVISNYDLRDYQEFIKVRPLQDNLSPELRLFHPKKGSFPIGKHWVSFCTSLSWDILSCDHLYLNRRYVLTDNKNELKKQEEIKSFFDTLAYKDVEEAVKKITRQTAFLLPSCTIAFPTYIAITNINYQDQKYLERLKKALREMLGEYSYQLEDPNFEEGGKGRKPDLNSLALVISTPASTSHILSIEQKERAKEATLEKIRDAIKKASHVKQTVKKETDPKKKLIATLEKHFYYLGTAKNLLHFGRHANDKRTIVISDNEQYQLVPGVWPAWDDDRMLSVLRSRTDLYLTMDDLLRYTEEDLLKYLKREGGFLLKREGYTEEVKYNYWMLRYDSIVFDKKAFYLAELLKKLHWHSSRIHKSLEKFIPGLHDFLKSQFGLTIYLDASTDIEAPPEKLLLYLNSDIKKDNKDFLRWLRSVYKKSEEFGEDLHLFDWSKIK